MSPICTTSLLKHLLSFICNDTTMFYISSPGLVTDAEDKIKWWKEVKLYSIRLKAFHFEYLFEANDEKLINNWFIRQHAFIEIWSMRKVWRAERCVRLARGYASSNFSRSRSVSPKKVVRAGQKLWSANQMESKHKLHTNENLWLDLAEYI